MILKKVQSFSIYGVAAAEDGSPLDLTGYNLASQIESGDSKVDLVAQVLSATDGTFRLDGTAAGLTVGTCKFDVKFTKDLIVDYSQTEKIEIAMAVTQ